MSHPCSAVGVECVDTGRTCPGLRRSRFCPLRSCQIHGSPCAFVCYGPGSGQVPPCKQQPLPSQRGCGWWSGNWSGHGCVACLVEPEGSGSTTQIPTLKVTECDACYFLCSFSLRLKQERELVLTQLSQDLAAELTELVVTERVRETCSQELK